MNAFPSDKAIHVLLWDCDAAWMVYMRADKKTENKRWEQYDEIRNILFDALSMEHLTFIEKHCHPNSDFGMATRTRITEKSLLEG